MATFGNLQPGGTQVQTPPANNKAVSKFTLDRTGSIDAVTLGYQSNPPGDFKAIIYDNTGSGGLPGALKGTSQARTNPIGTTIFTFSPAIALTAGDYWLGAIANATGLTNCATLTNGIAFNANTYASGPSTPFGASPSLASFRYPVNAGYTPTLTAGTYLGELRGGETVGTFAVSTLNVFAVTPSVAGSVTKLTMFVGDTYASAKVKGIIYDATGSGGAPGALLGTTNELTGPVINANDLTFASAVALNGGSTYYIGLLTDTSLGVYTRSLANAGYSGARTYSSGPPSTFPASPTVVSTIPAFWATFGALPSTPLTVATTQSTSVGVARSAVLSRTLMQAQALALSQRTTSSSRILAIVQPTQVALSRGMALRVTVALSQAQAVSLTVGKGYQRVVTAVQATAVARVLRIAKTRSVVIRTRVRKPGSAAQPIVRATARPQVRLVKQVRLARALSQPQSTTATLVRITVMRTVTAVQTQRLALLRAVTLTRALAQPQAALLPRGMELVKTLVQPTAVLVGRVIDLVRGVTVGSSASLDSLDVTVRYEVLVTASVSQQVALSSAEAGQTGKLFVVDPRRAEFVVGQRASSFAVGRRGVRFTVEER